MLRYIRTVFQPYMIRPTVYQSVTKISVALVLSLLWDRFLNPSGTFLMLERAFFPVGMFFLMLAWFQYLRMDGVSVHHLLEDKTVRKKPKRHAMSDIADFADEKIIPFAELEDDERTVCRFLSDFFCGLLFLIPALIVTVLLL